MSAASSASNDLESGNHLYQAGDTAGALRAYARYAAEKPSDKTGHYNLGVTLAAVRQFDAAIDCYKKAVAIDPKYADAWNNLGILYHGRSMAEAARHCFSKALAAHPEYEDAEYNLATVESCAGNFQQAILHFSQVLKRNPRNAAAWNNLGNALLALRAPAEALQAFELALSLEPEWPLARWNRSAAKLTLGQLPAGWDGFDARGKLRHTSIPRWSPKLASKQQRVLVHAEQGLGDTIQFVRYCHAVREFAADLTLECHAELIPLLRGVAGIDNLIPFGSPMPEVDCQIPLMSLAGEFGTDVGTVPSTVPYIPVDRNLARERRSRMKVAPGRLSVGLVWAGNPKHRNDRNRSLHPGLLGLLRDLENVDFFCLQQKPQSEDARAIQFAACFDELTFSDTAAIVSHLDLVISVDTAVAHLAGALGRPVWTLLPFVPDWRWMLDRSDSPWYPTMRLFRQTRLGDWESVLQAVKLGLQQLASASGNEAACRS